MAGDQDGDRVFTVGIGDGAGGFGISESLGFLGVGERFAVGDGAEHLPDLFLKRGALRIEREGKTAPLPFEIFVELSLQTQQQRMRRTYRIGSFIAEIECHEGIVADGCDECPDRGADGVKIVQDW